MTKKTLTHAQRNLAAAPRGFDGLMAARSGSLLGALVARVAQPEKVKELVPKPRIAGRFVKGVLRAD